MLRNRTLLAVSLAVAAAYTGIGMVGPVRVLYAQAQGASLEVIGAMASAFLLANFVAQYPTGWLADRWGRRRVMLIGLVVQAVLTLGYLPITDPLLFVGLRAVEGVAAASVLPSARAIIADAVPLEQRGRAYGLFGAFFNFGFLLGPAIGGLIATTGYANAFIGAALCRVAGALVVLALVPPDGAHLRQARARGRAVSRRALFRLPLVGAYILAFGDYLYLGFDLALMPLWLHDHLGASVAVIGLAYMAWAVPSVVLSPFSGQIADRARRSRLILIFGLAQVPIYVVYGLASSAWLVVGLFAVHGMVYAGVQPAVDSHVAAASPEVARARIQGLYTTVGLMGAFVGANALPPLYALDFRLPLFALGVGYGACILLGGLMIRRAEVHGQVSAPLAQPAAAGIA